MGPIDGWNPRCRTGVPSEATPANPVESRICRAEPRPAAWYRWVLIPSEERGP